MATGQLYKKVRIDTKAVDNVPRESGVRLYCESANTTWSLQTRSPMTLRNGREGKDFLVSTAYLGREQMVALRDAINFFLQDADLPPQLDDAKG